MKNIAIHGNHKQETALPRIRRDGIDGIFSVNNLIFGKCSTAGHGVFTISCPEDVGKTLQFTEETKH